MSHAITTTRIERGEKKMDKKKMVEVHVEDLERMRALFAEWQQFINPDDPDPVADDHILVGMAITGWVDMMEDLCKRNREIAAATAAGGRTDYMYDDDGNEYYVSQDGKRHYTRMEG